MLLLITLLTIMFVVSGDGVDAAEVCSKEPNSSSALRISSLLTARKLMIILLNDSV